MNLHKTILIFILTAIILSGLGFYAYYLLKQHRLAKSTIKELKNLMYYTPFPWCCWYINDEKVMVSEKFLELLGLNEINILNIQTIYRLFGQSSLSQFQRALNHICSFGGNFTLQINLELQNEKEFLVHGSIMTTESTGGQPKSLVLITLQDITSTTIDLKKQQNNLSRIEQESIMFKQYAEKTENILWHKDHNGRIVNCNQAYADALETSIPRVISENIELIPRKSVTLVNEKKRLHAVIKGQRRLLEIKETNTLSGVVGFAQDITEIENWESEVQRHAQSQREILENLSNAIAIYGPDTHLQYFNSAYLKTFQLQESFLYSKPTYSDVLENLHKRRKMIEVDDFKKHKANRLSLFNTIFEPLHEIHHQPDGTVLKMTVCPHALGGLLFVFEDISDKLSLERGYNTLLAVQKETIDNLYEGLVVIGTDLRLRLSNSACSKLLKMRDELRQAGTHVSEFVEGLKSTLRTKNFNHWKTYIYDIIEKRIPITETMDILPEGKLQVSYIPLPDGSHLLTFIDIYDRWKSEQIIKDRNETLEQADRLKNNFISHVSYELRAPLNTISGFIDILKNQYFGPLNERQLDYCNGIQDSNTKLMDLIADMVELASIEAGKLSLNYTNIILEKFLESCVTLIQNRSFDQGVDVNIINNSKILNFQADEKRLKQAIFNLLENSLKFTLSGGQVSIIAFDVEETENTLGICISDTGIGINAEEQQKIFDMLEYGSHFQSTQKSSGLGLNLVKRLVELHHGKIFIVSQINEGTKVIIHIPINQLLLL